MARANIFDDDDDKVVPINPGTDLNIDDFAPSPNRRRVDLDDLKKSAALNGYPDRAPQPEHPATTPAAPTPDTRYRTGRNIQLGLKVTAQYDDRFKILCDGERRNVTFELAIDALWRERFGRDPD